MVYRSIGRSADQIRQSPLATRISARLVHGCLTVPFDKKTVACIQGGYGFVRCTEDLGARKPETQRALEELSGDLKELLPRGRAPLFR